MASSTPSDNEKYIGVEREERRHSRHEMPPDPDAGLSEEERAKIVR